MKSINEDYILENGVKIPKIGFGTWQIPNGKIAFDAVSFALKTGYRHIDTAHAYRNESSVGRAARESGIERNKIFVTSKLPAEVKTYDGALASFDKTMKELDLDDLDLYLIHAPWPWGKMGEDFTKENIRVWKAMEEIYKKGHCRAIGVSNFNVGDLTALMKTCEIKPMVNQIRYFIGYTQTELARFCQQNHVLVEGYSPLATGAILDNKSIASMAHKYNTTLPGICIRYVLQKGMLPLPKSVHPDYIRQNVDVDFIISEDDMNYLDGLRDTARF